MNTELAIDLRETGDLIFVAPIAGREPETTSSSRAVSWHEMRPGNTSELPTAKFYKLTASTQKHLQEDLQVAAAVQGTVIEVEDASVLCSVSTGDTRVELRLLPAIFPETPQFGMAFELAMVTIAGVQQPRITLRQESPADDELARKVDEILASFI